LGSNTHGVRTAAVASDLNILQQHVVRTAAGFEARRRTHLERQIPELQERRIFELHDTATVSRAEPGGAIRGSDDQDRVRRRARLVDEQQTVIVNAWRKTKRVTRLQTRNQ